MEIQNQTETLQEFCIKWAHYETNLKSSIENWLHTGSFVDCTLACDGFSLKVHKVVLSACSPYFQSLLIENPCDHPIIILKDVNFSQLKLLVEFMYRGEICAADDEIPALLKIAEILKIRGLTNVNTEKNSFSTSTVNPIYNKVDNLAGPEYEHEPATKVRRLSESKKKEDTGISLFGNAPGNLNKTIHSDVSLLTASRQVQKCAKAKYENRLSLDITSTNSKLSRPPNIYNLEKLPNVNSHLTDDTKFAVKFKAPMWTQAQLQDAIQAVVTQRMKFSQAASSFSIPKGTLYDNILGKSKRMVVLDEAGLSAEEENAVLEYCCDETAWSYKRRTALSLTNIIEYVEKLRRLRDPGFTFTGLSGFRWWWAFCKKHSIISLYTDKDSCSINIKNEDSEVSTQEY